VKTKKKIIMGENISAGNRRVLRFIVSFILLLQNLQCNTPFSQCFYRGDYSKGMNIFFKPPRNTFTEADFSESLARLKSDGINTVFLVPYYISENENSDDIDSTSETLPDSQLYRAIELSKRYGFSVILKPHIDLKNDVPRYKINPTNYSRWIINYKSFILRYLTIAVNAGLHDFVIGTELDDVVENEKFYDFCDSIRNVYSMRLIYAASFNHFLSTGLWNHVDIIGVNAYFNLDDNLPPSISRLHETWNYWLNVISDFSALKGKPVIFTEVCYFSRSTAAQNPGTWSGNPPADCNVQKECYEALLSQACNFERIIGICWWQWELNKIGGLSNNDATPRDKPAEEVLRSYWSK
jgi:hypothetical protein